MLIVDYDTKKSIREAFGKKLVELGAINPNIAYLDYCSQLSNWLLLQLYFQNGSQSDLLKICQIMIFFSICPLTSHLTHNKS